MNSDLVYEHPVSTIFFFYLLPPQGWGNGLYGGHQGRAYVPPRRNHKPLPGDGS